MNPHARPRAILIGLLVLAVATLALAPFVGPVAIEWSDVIGGGTDGATMPGRVFWTLRVPRVALGALAGASLALAGCVFQSLFRNPLAEPFTLGVASGASLGVAVALHLGWTGLLLGFLPGMTVLAFGGAMLSVVVVYAIARLRSGGSSSALLLGGVSIGFVCAAVILLIEFLSARPVTNAIVRWLMGSLDRAGSRGLFETLPPVAVAAAVVWYLHKTLDLLMMGELVAAGRGVSVRRARRVAYFAASIMTAAIVAQCGPIAFVGLLVPHAMRALCGPVHRRLLPASVLAGAAFLPWCDVIASNLLRWLYDSSLQIPVGVLTNLLGGAFFIYLLLTRREEAVVESP